LVFYFLTFWKPAEGAVRKAGGGRVFEAMFKIMAIPIRAGVGNMKEQKASTQRGFMKSAAATCDALAGASTLGGEAPAKATHSAIPKKWDREADVVCIGYGGAGAATAISAHDAGAKVLILEKMSRGGGNTAVSLGGFLCPNNVADALTYITALFGFTNAEMDKDLVRVFAEESVRNADWIKSLREGTRVSIYGGANYADVPGAKAMDKYIVRGKGKGMSGSSGSLWDLLCHAVEQKRKIPVMLETPALRLVTGVQGEVIGVIALSKGRQIAIKAKKGVVLTTGGYEFDAKTLQNSVKGFPIYATGNPGNTGDGVRMAQKVGAGLWHMNGVSCPLGIKVPEFEAAFFMRINRPGFIIVDRHGKRFVNEKAIESHASLLAIDFYDTHALEYPRIPCYAIFDEATRIRGPISPSTGRGYNGTYLYKWSRDNAAEIRKGWIMKGDTIEELAAKLKMAPKVLEGTITRWNGDVKKGEDTQFHRPVNAPKPDNPARKGLVTAVWSAPLEKGPFYALELYPTLLNTQGGPRRNAKAQVLDAFGAPIPRLYSAGELGSMWGIIYQGAGNIGECFVYGRIAGKNASAEKPWK
jgi:succinate dehydrogenase/fumarate reductase flavoprotein subunit